MMAPCISSKVDLSMYHTILLHSQQKADSSMSAYDLFPISFGFYQKIRYQMNSGEFDGILFLSFISTYILSLASTHFFCTQKDSFVVVFLTSHQKGTRTNHHQTVFFTFTAFIHSFFLQKYSMSVLTTELPFNDT